MSIGLVRFSIGFQVELPPSRCDSWEPTTTIHQTKTENGVEVVDRGALHSGWQIIEERKYGTHFSVGAIPLSLYDQGRAVCGVYHGMGAGVKVTARRFASSREVVARAGARLLSFVPKLGAIELLRSSNVPISVEVTTNCTVAYLSPGLPRL